MQETRRFGRNVLRDIEEKVVDMSFAT